MSKPISSPYLTIPEVAAHLRVSERTVFNLLAAGDLERTKLLSSRTVIERTALQAFIDRAARPNRGRT